MSTRPEPIEATLERAKQTIALRSRVLLSMGMGQLTIDGHPDLNARDAEGKTPALQTRSIETFQLLVLAGGDPLATDTAGRNAFDLAIERKCDEMAIHLLRLHPALTPAGEALDAAFVAAVRKNCVNTVKKLAEIGADVGQKPDGRTLLQCAPRGAEDLKRLLRSLKSTELLARAMPESGDDQPATSNPPTL